MTTDRLKNSAVLFMDFQVDVCSRGGKMISQDDRVLNAFEKARQNAAKLLQDLRCLQNPPAIVHIQHVFDPGYPQLAGARHSGMDSYVQSRNAFVDGSSGAEIVKELQAAKGEYVIKKHTLSPFASTELVWWLIKRGISRIVLSGVVTHYVVLASAFSAYDSGFEVTVLKDCCMSGTEETHNISLEILEPICHIISSDKLLV